MHVKKIKTNKRVMEKGKTVKPQLGIVDRP